MNIRIVLLALGLLLGPNQPLTVAQVPDNNYSLSINVASDRDSFTNYTVSLIRSGAAKPITNSVASRYSLISFNTPKDILWASCANGYRITRATSTTGTHVLRMDASDPESNAGIEFSERRPYRTYNFTISCASKSNTSEAPSTQGNNWDAFFTAFRAAVRRRDRVALRGMMTVEFNTLGGVSYPGPDDERGDVLRNINWNHLDGVLRKGVGPLQRISFLARGKTIRQAPPLLKDVGMVAFFELGKDGRWRWSDFYFYH
jgi:hypothetical protein